MADDVIGPNDAQKQALEAEGAERVSGGKDDNILARKSDETYIEINLAGEIKEVEAPKERTQLEAVQGSAITVPARLGFDQQQVVAIRNTVAADCNNAELVMFLEVAARYGLDPFAKQIYAAKIKGRVQIIVSRDGLLAHAHKQESFVQMDGDYICANDDFNVGFKDGKRTVEHSYTTKADPAKDSAEPDNARGPLIAAWARVVREGHGETFFVANLSEYKQDREGPWQKTPAAMILKCAETYALRKAFSISGVVGEDEIEKERKLLTDLESGKTRELPFSNIDFGPEPRASYLAQLAEVANQIRPGSYRPAKLAALAADPEGLVNELSAFITKEGGDVPQEPLDGEVVGEEDIDPVATPA